MKTFLIVLVMMVNANGYEDLYVIQEPTFENPKQCIAYVRNNANQLVGKAQLAYDGHPVQDIYCVEKNKLQTIVQGQAA